MVTACKAVVVLVVFRLPGAVRRRIFKRWLGWDIHPSARVGLSLVFARYVSMGCGSRIGHGNVIRSMNVVSLGDNARIGQWNWITAEQSLARLAAKGGMVILRDHAVVTSRHYLDCSGGLEIGEYTIIAGIRSTILSHQFDLVQACQTVAPVTIGDYCFLSSDVRITPGSKITDRCLVAMGAVVVKDLDDSNCLYGGVPARSLKRIDEALYFRDPTNARWAHLEERDARAVSE